MGVCQVWLITTTGLICGMPAKYRVTLTRVRGINGYADVCEYHASIYSIMDHEVVELEQKQEEQVEQDYPGL